MAVFAAISHKGGAGRSTAVANAAYQAANSGHSVCLVDFDLDSATLGAVLGLADGAVGGRTGIQTLLAAGPAPDLSANQLLVDLHTASFRDPIKFTGGNPGSFDLLPGSVDQLNLVDDEEMAARLAVILGRLEDTYDIVLVDVRAGKSEALRALLYGARQLQSFSFLMFYRWTYQHLEAATDMVKTLGSWSDAFDFRPAIIPVSTARISRADVAQNPWFAHQYDLLEKTEEKQITTPLQRPARVIPFDRVFQWKEQVLSGHQHAGSPATVAAFQSLGVNLVGGQL